MSASEDNFKDRHAEALNECQSFIDWYKRHQKTPRNLYWTSQITTIALSAITPVLILITGLPKWMQALPAALAAIAAALINIFHWQEHWVRRTATLEALEAELLKYKTRTSPAYDINLDEQQALSNFVEQITNLHLNEVSSWGKVQNRSSEKGT